ncbi:pleckstrin domain-containing protein [Cavenderia fasciculata]|uniref:Pleckstrin domain-containing protein n=1 Tax=Cavenderia fasciculata TaxID=261658 RepID=F4QBR2_CACFS|nr:pleckstrin domain-containing protein [Cavenderia fasciculata]EGG14650.1 pleckstrin domain-containing protein [Cavenderia fasciculata]|eukprot:XP_004351158.1 pleckstrin domain-containing protein [Cavenderia fasciculata]
MERLRSNIEKLSSTDVSLQENCLRYLINSSTESEYQVTILYLLGISKTNELLKSNNEVIQMLSTWLLSHLCLNLENCITLLKSEIIETLMRILVSENQDVAEKGLWVLTNLTLCSEHSHLLVDYGVVEALTFFLKRSNHNLIILATVPLRNILHKDTCGEYLDNQKALCHSGAIQSITKLLTSQYPTPSNELILALTSIIHVLSIYHPLIRRILAISGVLQQLIAYLSSPSSPEPIKEQVLKILINLSLTEETEKPILDSGAMMPLIETLVSVSSPLSLKSLSVSCLANLTSNQDIRRILRSKYLIDGICELLKERSSHSSQLLEALALLIANLCTDEICRYMILQSDCNRILTRFIDHSHPQVKESIQKAIENLSVPISASVHNELNVKEDLSDLDPTDSLGPSLSLSPSPINKGIMRFSRSISPQTLRNTLEESSPRLSHVDEPNMSFRRGKIIKEIIDTEQAYIYALNICIRVYYNPLVVAPTSPPILPLEVVESIFSNIDKVFRVNCEFLKKLRSLASSTEKIDIIELAQAFQWLWDKEEKPDQSDQFSTIKEYRTYINGFNRAMDLIHENRAKVPRFKEFLDRCQFSDQCKSETLESYLIRPVQRIPRYILLLNDLLLHTVDVLERDSLEDALGSTKIVADQLNEAKRRAENQNKTIQFQDKVVGLPDSLSLTQKLLIKDGLMMEARQKKVSKYVYLLLFNDYLYVTQQKKNKYLVKKSINLVDVKILDTNESTINVENAFKILWSGKEDRNENGIILCSSNPESKEEWVKEIRDSANNLKRAQIATLLKSHAHTLNPRVE